MQIFYPQKANYWGNVDIFSKSYGSLVRPHCNTTGCPEMNPLDPMPSLICNLDHELDIACQDLHNYKTGHTLFSLTTRAEDLLKWNISKGEVNMQNFKGKNTYNGEDTGHGGNLHGCPEKDTLDLGPISGSTLLSPINVAEDSLEADISLGEMVRGNFIFSCYGEQKLMEIINNFPRESYSNYNGSGALSLASQHLFLSGVQQYGCFATFHARKFAQIGKTVLSWFPIESLIKYDDPGEAEDAHYKDIIHVYTQMKIKKGTENKCQSSIAFADKGLGHREEIPQGIV